MKQPFDRTIINPLEKPLADDINQAATNIDYSLRFFAAALFQNLESGTPDDGFMSNSFKVVPNSPEGLSVILQSGLGFQLINSTEIAIDGVVGLDDLETYKPLPLVGNQTFVVPAPPLAPNSRIDIIEVRAERVTTDPSNRQVFDPGLGQFVPGILQKTLAWALDGKVGTVNAPASSTQPISYVVGQEGNPGVAPPTTPGYIKVAEIFVDNGALTISDAEITDSRVVITDREFLMHYPAAGGYPNPGSTSAEQFLTASVALNGGQTPWYINIGLGMQEGDIVEDVVVVVERQNGPTNDIQTNFWLTEFDFSVVPGSSSLAIKSRGNTGPTGPLGVYEIGHRDNVLPFPDPPGTFPFVWTKGAQGVIEAVSLTEDDLLHSAYLIVRRPVIKRPA